MTRNPKQNRLPRPLDDMIDRDGRVRPTAPLIVDYYLSREAVVERIAEQAGIDLNSPHLFDPDDMATLTALIVDDTPDPDTLRRDRAKYDLIRMVGTELGFETHGHQSKLIKSQLIHVLLSLRADEPPERFQVPCDPDLDTIETPDDSRVPTLS